MSKRVTAIRLNIHPNYFYQLKNTNRKALEYITSLDVDLFNAYNKYTDEQQTIKDKLTDIYYLLSDLTLLSQFSKYLHKKEYYRNWNGFSTTINGILFGIKEGFHSHKVFIKCKILLDEFNIFYVGKHHA